MSCPSKGDLKDWIGSVSQTLEDEGDTVDAEASINKQQAASDGEPEQESLVEVKAGVEAATVHIALEALHFVIHTAHSAHLSSHKLERLLDMFDSMYW